MTSPTKDTLLNFLNKLKPIPQTLIDELNDDYEFTVAIWIACTEAQWERIAGIPNGIFIYNHLHPPASIDAMDVDDDQQLPSPEPKGERIDLDASSLLGFLERQMINPNRFHCVPHVIRSECLAIQLCGRDDALNKAAVCMEAISKPITSVSDRINRKIPVCSGLSGLGKTRMLEEWEHIFDLACIPESRLGVLVLYHNGHMPHPVERKMGIEASFAWRLLHRCFIEGNGEVFARWFTESLPKNGGKLTLRLALEVIRQKYVNLGTIEKDETLHLFLGVDEYQTIHEVGGKKKGNEELLQDLLNLLADIMASPVTGVRIYPMFAGTDFSVISIVNSSRTESLRMPMYLLTQSDMETAISSVHNGDRLLLHAPVRRHLFYLGGVPRWFTEYVLRLLKEMENIASDDFLAVETIENVFKEVKSLYVEQWGQNLDAIDFIHLASFAISGIPVNLAEKKIHDMKWSRVRDSSLCLLNEDRQVILPYAIIRLVAGYTPDGYSCEAIEAFIICLRGLIDKVDALIYDKAPWQLWEVFGAFYHALRINALIIISGSNCQVKKLFGGAIMNGCDDEVELRPMLVMETEDKFSHTMTRNFGRKGHYNEQHDWLTGGYVVINGEGGKGVDVFFALKKKSSNGYVVITDQRKRVGGNNLGPISVSNLLKKARIKPDIFEANSTVITCLFSCVTFANVSDVDLGEESVVVSYNQYQQYHGTLSSHPASCPLVKINTDPVSYILMVLTGKDRRKLADAVLVRRKVQIFTTFDDLENFVVEQKLEATYITDLQQRVSFC